MCSGVLPPARSEAERGGFCVVRDGAGPTRSSEGFEKVQALGSAFLCTTGKCWSVKSTLSGILQPFPGWFSQWRLCCRHVGKWKEAQKKDVV